ncbi:MAG TPA: GNAT family protein [Thermomicrobiales bacterium]|nr:GNAT family protein [Thermomicrobiales bacterium]
MRIETERLILREFREADWQVMLEYWNAPLYQRYNPDLPDREGFVRHLVALFVGSQSELPRRNHQLAIVRKQDGRLIGNCGIRVNDPDLGEANIGYELDPRDWGNGYATEAASAIVRFGFEDLSLHRIWAECIADNTGSFHVLEKLGMRREAHFREHKYFKDRWWDTLIYAVLDHEWRSPNK